MLSTKEITKNYVTIAKGKVSDSIINTLLLSMMAGIFVAFAGIGCCFATSIAGKFIGACVFPAGIIMVILGGGKLFTGDCLLIIPLLGKDVKLKETIKTLALVYLGNFIGSLLIAIIAVESGALEGVKTSVIDTAVSKSSISFVDALLRGVLCNILVCVSVMLSLSTENVAGKIFAMFFPIIVFVLAGFEHCVANMYFLPAGIFTALRYGITENLTTMLTGLYANLIPVTIGNIIGGFSVGAVYKFSSYEKVENGIKKQ